MSPVLVNAIFWTKYFTLKLSPVAQALLVQWELVLSQFYQIIDNESSQLLNQQQQITELAVCIMISWPQSQCLSHWAATVHHLLLQIQLSFGCNEEEWEEVKTGIKTLLCFSNFLTNNTDTVTHGKLEDKEEWWLDWNCEILMLLSTAGLLKCA